MNILRFSRGRRNRIPHDDLDEEKINRTISTFELVFIIFFCVSGGSYGMEEGVRAGYPYWMLMGLVISPFIWSAPSALMTAELSTAIPENGGKIVWIKKAFGPFWALQVGYWSWIFGLADNALYPAMFLEYLVPLFGEISYFTRFFTAFLIIVIFTVLNIRGMELVGKASIIFAITVISPFLGIGLLGLPHLNSLYMKVKPPGIPDWGLFLSVLLWNTSGWDNSASMAGEIKSPQRTYPKALAIALILVTLIYIWPLSVAVSVQADYGQWRLGYFTSVAQKVGGTSFAVFVATVGLIAALGMFNVHLCTASRSLFAMAPDDLVGWDYLSHIHPKYKTPSGSILLTGIGVFLFSFLSWDYLVQIAIFMYSLTLIAEFFALYRLRITFPSLDRPYKIPLSGWKLGIFIFPPIVLCFILMLYVNAFVQTICVGLVIGGLALHSVVTWRRQAQEQMKESQLTNDVNLYFVPPNQSDNQ